MMEVIRITGFGWLLSWLGVDSDAVASLRFQGTILVIVVCERF